MCRPELQKKYEEKIKSGTYRHKNAKYAGMVESLDDSVGRVLAELEKQGVADNTVIIFTGDNGAVGNDYTLDLRGAKGFAHEGATREPFFIKWPGETKAGSTCDVPVIGTDFYPTMLDIAKLPARPDQHPDGLSLVPLLKGGSSLKARSLFWHYPHYHKTKPYGAIRNGNFKLIEFFEDGALELYDLAADHKESNNIAAIQPEKAQALLAELNAWRKSVDAQMMTANPNYDPTGAGKSGKKRKAKKK
jgi:arylsulfatase A-like enzyme